MKGFSSAFIFEHFITLSGSSPVFFALASFILDMNLSASHTQTHIMHKCVHTLVEK